MEKTASSFAVGVHRPVYLWAGPGTVRMNQLKFMGAPVNADGHREAHTPVGAQRMAQEAQFSWAYLMYDWGFPPEVAQQDWQDFAKAVDVYHKAGIKVFGYVQTSNCVQDGSYKDKDWYALDPKGRPFYYYTGRYMVCWRNAQWQAHLRDVVRGIVEAKADGVFFDNPWYGAQPIHAGRSWLGPVGCYCDRCQTAFWEAAHHQIPTTVTPADDEESQHYIHWRAKQVTRILQQLADHARELRPDIVISANNFDAVMRPSYFTYGIDLQALSKVQDVMMIENFALPRLEEHRLNTLLVNNALTIRSAQALVGETPLSVDPYDKGIGFDDVYPAQRLKLAIAEAAACGVPMVVKGSEYVDATSKTFTLLTAEHYSEQRAAVGDLHRWLASRAELYLGREDAANVALLHPGDALWQHWDALAPLYFAVGQTLTVSRIPWRVVTKEHDLSNLEALFYFGKLPSRLQIPAQLKCIDVLNLPGWGSPQPTLWARNANARKFAQNVVESIYRAYFQWRWARKLGDRLGLAHYFLQSPYFQVPSATLSKTLLEALGPGNYPQVQSESPVLVTYWRQGDQWQLHLVNYKNEPQSVIVDFGQPVNGKICSPDGAGLQFIGLHVDLTLDTYSVLTYGKKEAPTEPLKIGELNSA